jgi:hypothetical protein
MRIFILDPDPSVQIKAPTLEKMLKQTHIPYILNFHLQVDADPVPDPACHFDADPGPVFLFDADPEFYLMRMRIRIHNTGNNYNCIQFSLLSGTLVPTASLSSSVFSHLPHRADRVRNSSGSYLH